MTQPTNHSPTQQNYPETIPQNLCGLDFGEHAKALRRVRMFRDAHILLGKKNFSEALTLAQQCFEPIQQTPPEPSRLSMDSHLVAGRCYCGMAQYSHALGEFQRALTLSESLPDTTPAQATILGNLGSTFATLGDSPAAIAVFQKRLALLEQAASQASLEQSLVCALKIETLKELSALSFAEHSYENAEKFAYELAQLQESGLELGKTLLLLAQIFQASGNQELSLTTVTNARIELLRGDAEYYEPLVLSTSLRLEAHLLLQAGQLETSYHCYDAAYQILKTVQGAYHVRTLLCDCDRSLVDMHRGNLLPACDAIELSIEQALHVGNLSSQDPLLRPYLQAHAMLSHRIAEALRTTLEMLRGVPLKTLHAGYLAECLHSRDLHFLAKPLTIRLQTFIANQASSDRFIRSLVDDTHRYLTLALRHFIQVLGSLEEQFGPMHPETAPTYERLRDVSATLGDDTMACFYDQRAARIRNQE